MWKILGNAPSFIFEVDILLKVGGGGGGGCLFTRCHFNDISICSFCFLHHSLNIAIVHNHVHTAHTFILTYCAIL